MTFRHWWWRRDIQIVIKSGLSDSDRVVTTTLRQRYTRDVHNVTSPVVPFVNCVSHIVNTCTRRNFNFYPKKCIDVISHVVVWYDWKYEVTNCAWKKKDPKAEQFLFFFFSFSIHTCETGRRSHENPCWFWHMYIRPNVFRSALFADGLRDLELEKSGWSSFGLGRANCAFREENYRRKSTL